MANSAQRLGWISETGLRTMATMLRFAVLLISMAFVSQSAQSQTYSVLYSFTGGKDGGQPGPGLFHHGPALYGAAFGGGNPTCLRHFADCGVVFRLTLTGIERPFHKFKGPDGLMPTGGLVFDDQGNAYGTTYFGGDTGCATHIACGVVYRLENPTGELTVLHAFSGNPDGEQPSASLIFDSVGGNLYGVTRYGGTFNSGTIFQMSTSGTETVLYSFRGGADGQGPYAKLIEDAQGNLYGTTEEGGDLTCGGSGCGTVFKLDTSGNETVLHSFTNGADGGYPLTALVMDTQGNLYGTTNVGGDPTCNLDGTPGCGTVYEIDATGNFSVLHAFTGGADGAFPAYGRMEWNSKNGTLYGTTGGGGAFRVGVIFQMDTSGNETVLYTFTGELDGAYPNESLTVDRSGNLYGTTLGGGAFSQGVVFKLAP